MSNDATNSPTAEPWPNGLAPTQAPVSAYNEFVVPAGPEQVWQRLIHATAWPQWYANSKRVVLDGGGTELGAGTVFHWTTFGVRATCQVVVFKPGLELAWAGRAVASTGYHRWLLQPLADGRTRVVTEETQRGLVPSLGARWLRRGLLHWHQRWLEGIAP